MQYLNPINYGSVDAQIIGIIVVIPVTNIEQLPVIATYHKCEGCERSAQQYKNFCSHCGGKIIEVTGKVKCHNGYEMEAVPFPDVRQEFKDLGIEYHLPFGEDEEVLIGQDESMVWKFVFKSYATIGDRQYHVPFLEELDLEQIQNDLKEAKEKFKEVIKKYKGKVVFGIAGEFADW